MKESTRDLKRDRVKPTVGTYNPLNQSYRTFDSISRSSSTSSVKRKKNGFGSDTKFPYMRPDKKKIKEVRPSPASYETGVIWKGKNYKSDSKQWH